MTDELENEGPSPELIQEARSMGWRPKEEFKGPEDKWVDAEEFVEKGRHIMPILLANNERLKKDLLTRDQKIGTLQNDLKSAQDAIARLDKHFSESNKRDVEAAKAVLKERLKDARKEDDVDAEFEIQEQLAKLNKSTDQPVVPDKKVEEKETLSPAFVQWNEENPWFGGASSEDRKKTKAFLRIGEDLRDEGSTLVGREFMEECQRIYDRQNSKEDGKGPGKYESGSNRSSGRSGGGSKSYNSLPAEAKQACLEDADMLVGEGKKFKTLDDWKAAYAAKYYEE